MPACVFLFPNALLSPKDLETLKDSAFPESLQTMLLTCSAGSSTELFNNEALYGPAWQQWFWMLLTGRDDLLPTAPHLWSGLGGEKLNAQLWLLSPYVKREGKILGVPLSKEIEELCLVQDFLNPIIKKYGFKVQAIDNWFFISRNDPWDVQIPIWEAQEGKPPAIAVGSNAKDWEILSEELSSKLPSSDLNQYRISQGLTPIEGFWINGGGDDSQLPFTKIRSVQTQSPLIKGIAIHCGIPPSRVTIERNFWRDIPDGDRVAIFSEFLNTDLKSDPVKWKEAWDKASKRVAALLESANGKEKYHPFFVATDDSHVSTAMPKTTKSFLPFTSKSNKNCISWLTAQTNTK